MSFKPLSVDAKTRYVTGVTNFSGLDTSTQRFQVSQSHAIDLNNFIYKDGVIQKRQGTEELFKVEATRYVAAPFDGKEVELTDDSYKTNDTNFNGIWSVTGEDNKLHIIAHIGHLLYEIKNYNTEEISIDPIVYDNETYNYNQTIYIHAYEFENYKSSAFVGAKRLYFLGGNKYMCMKFNLNNSGDTVISLYPIENHEDTYIPTTTTSITYKNSAVSGRASLDNVNLLNKFRINELISGTLKSEDEKTKTPYYDYTLDAPLICESESDMKDVLIILKEGGTVE